MSKPYSILDYATLSDAFAAYTAWRRQTTAAWSFGTWARQLDVKSTGYLWNVLHGKRPPNRELLARFATNMQLDPEETAYLKLLAGLARAEAKKQAALVKKFRIRLVAARYSDATIGWTASEDGRAQASSRFAIDPARIPEANARLRAFAAEFHAEFIAPPELSDALPTRMTVDFRIEPGNLAYRAVGDRTPATSSAGA